MRAAEAAPAAPQALPRGKETILFVEDEPMVRKHTGAQIVKLGYAVVIADNAAEALALVEDGSRPTCLFTDVVMPGGMNGRQLALKLRERWPDLRVLYTSGYAHGRLTIDGESVPTKYVLGKPYRRPTSPPSCARCSTSRCDGEFATDALRLDFEAAAAARSRPRDQLSRSIPHDRACHADETLPRRPRRCAAGRRAAAAPWRRSAISTASTAAIAR